MHFSRTSLWRNGTIAVLMFIRYFSSVCISIPSVSIGARWFLDRLRKFREFDTIRAWLHDASWLYTRIHTRNIFFFLSFFVSFFRFLFRPCTRVCTPAGSHATSTNIIRAKRKKENICKLSSPRSNILSEFQFIHELYRIYHSTDHEIKM